MSKRLPQNTPSYCLSFYITFKIRLQSKMRVTLGTRYLLSGSPNECGKVTLGVSEVILNPDWRQPISVLNKFRFRYRYNSKLKEFSSNDVALIKVNCDISFNQFVRPICLSRQTPDELDKAR